VGGDGEPLGVLPALADLPAGVDLRRAALPIIR
jgi:hypothetical protein